MYVNLPVLPYFISTLCFFCLFYFVCTAPSLVTNQSITTNSKITESNTLYPVTTSIHSNVTNENEIETTPKYDKADNKIDILNGLNVENPSTENSTPEAKETNETFDNTNHNSNNNDKEKEIPEITIREIIPEVKEIPITGPPKREILITHVDDTVHNNDLLDTDTESSEILENYQPPPVLRIGDKLLFLKKGEFVPEKDVSTPSPVITIIGAEGLQRGFEDSLENHEFVINENLDKNNSATDDDDVVGSESVIIEERIDPKKETNPKREINSSNDLPKQLIPTMHPLNLNKESLIPLEETKTETENKPSTKVTLPDESLTSIDIDNTTIDIAVEMPTLSSVLIEESTEYGKQSTTETNPISSTHSPKEVDEYVENPEYPPIPDIMNLPNVEEQTEHLDQSKQSSDVAKILPDVLVIRSNKTIVNSTHSEWLKTNSMVNKDAILDEEILSQVAPSDLESTTELQIGESAPVTEIVVIKPKEQTERNVEEDIARLIAKYSMLTQAVDKLKQTAKSNPIVTQVINTTDVVPTIAGIASDERSTETLENISIEKIEATTPPGSKSSTLSTENASVEPENISLISDNNTPTDSTTIETTEPTTARTNSREEKQEKTFNVKEMVEMLPEDMPGISKNSKNMPKDVEIISSKEIQENKLKKRTNDDGDDIFKELNQELDIIDHPEMYTKSPEEEKAEAELIFKELLDEIEGIKSESKGKEAEQVSKVIAKYNIKNTKQSIDTSLLGILREFINSQRLYNQHP